MLSVPYLHLTVDNPRVLALAVDVVDLREVVLLPQVGVEDVVQVDGEDAEEAAGPGRVDGVAGAEIFSSKSKYYENISYWSVSVQALVRSARALLARRSRTSL